MKEHLVELPDGLGTLQIQLDSNLLPTGQWSHPSDYECGREWVWGLSYAGWPVLKDTSYLTPSPDSLMQFMVRVFPYSPAECDSALDAAAWLNASLWGEQIERPNQAPTYHGFTERDYVQWSFFGSSRHTGLYVDLFEGYRECEGRAILLRWQRIAPSPPSFEFGPYCRAQFETVFITMSHNSSSTTQ